jgi:uncharacterized protein
MMTMCTSGSLRLVHDLGHGPFSHVSEYLLDRFAVRSPAATAFRREEIHEKITADLLTRHQELVPLLSDTERQAVLAILQGNGSPDYRHDIISSSLDADKMDYLLRDSYSAGVQYGHFDLDKVVDSCRIRRDGTGSYLMVDEDGRFAVEQLVLSKHHMTQQVYSHRVRTVTDAMIVRGLELVIGSEPAIKDVYAYDGSDAHLGRYTAVDDAGIASMVLSSMDGRAQDMFRRLRHRDLFKELALLPIDGAHFPDSLIRGRLQRLSTASNPDLEEAVAATLGVQAWQIIVTRKSIKNPAYWTPGAIDPEAIQVLTREGTPRQLNEYDDIVVARLRSVERLHVIGPRESWRQKTPEQRRRAQHDLNERLAAVVTARLGRAG